MMRLGVTSPFSNLIASSVLIGQRGLVHIWGQNNTTGDQRMGITWTVRDPEGLLVEDYSDWESWPGTSPGDTHEFIGGRFEFFKEGTYTINVELFMNPNSPVVVDSYAGALCTVVAEEPEPEPEPEPAPEPEEKINWLPIILIGGGVVLAAVVLAPKKTRT